MKTYNFTATVNYPNDEADTPQYTDQTIPSISALTSYLLANEPDATSFVIIITVKQEKPNVGS